MGHKFKSPSTSQRPKRLLFTPELRWSSKNTSIGGLYEDTSMNKELLKHSLQNKLNRKLFVEQEIQKKIMGKLMKKKEIRKHYMEKFKLKISYKHFI